MTKTSATNTATAAPTPQGTEQANQELVMFLERDQLASGTAVPFPRAPLGTHARAALWALRVFVILVSGMVIYTFATQLQ